MTRPSNEFPSYSGLLPVATTDEIALVRARQLGRAAAWLPAENVAILLTKLTEHGC